MPITRGREPEFFFVYKRTKRNGDTAHIALGRPFAMFLIVVCGLFATAFIGPGPLKIFATPLVRLLLAR